MKVSETRSSDFEYISFLECNDLLSKTQLQREGGGLQWANLCKKKKKKMHGAQRIYVQICQIAIPPNTAERRS